MLVCAHASAEEPPVDRFATHALSIETNAGLAWIKNQTTSEPFAPYYFFELAPTYRLSRFVSLGGAVSYTGTIVGGGLQFWRVAGEARVHAIRTRVFDAWADGELGMAVTTFTPGGCGDCPAPLPSDTATHVEPLLGAGLGLDLMPVPYFTIGVIGRGMVIVFGTGSDKELPAGPSPAVFAGLTLGANIPL